MHSLKFEMDEDVRSAGDEKGAKKRQNNVNIDQEKKKQVSLDFLKENYNYFPSLINHR